ncbi:DUF262 domain-containing protein [Gammaproteobacteria bacterium]
MTLKETSNDQPQQQDENPGEKLEAEEGLTLQSEGIYPDAVVNVSRDQYSAFELQDMKTNQELVLSPVFQRNAVWNNEQKRELVESLLMGIPIPIIYLFADENGVKQVVDGRQRINAIIDFMEDKFPLDNLKMLPQFNKKLFSKLPPLYKQKIKRYQILVYLIEPPTPERVKYDIFDRVNRGGTRLNNQEMRNALYNGAATELLKRLSTSSAFQKATGDGIKDTRMRDQYVILRFLGFYLLRQKKINIPYKSNIDDFLAAVMKWLNKADQTMLEQLESCFSNAMENCYKVLGADAFRFSPTNTSRRPINMALFEALSYFFVIFPIKSDDTEGLAERLKTLKVQFDESGNFTSPVDSSVRVEYRFSAIEAFKEELTC